MTGFLPTEDFDFDRLESDRSPKEFSERGFTGVPKAFERLDLLGLFVGVSGEWFMLKFWIFWVCVFFKELDTVGARALWGVSGLYFWGLFDGDLWGFLGERRVWRCESGLLARLL